MTYKSEMQFEGKRMQFSTHTQNPNFTFTMMKSELAVTDARKNLGVTVGSLMEMSPSEQLLQKRQISCMVSLGKRLKIKSRIQ